MKPRGPGAEGVLGAWVARAEFIAPLPGVNTVRGTAGHVSDVTEGNSLLLPGHPFRVARRLLGLLRFALVA